MNILRIILCSATLLLTVGCTSTKTVTPDMDLANYLKRGESMVVYQQDGSMDALLFGKVTETHLLGSLNQAPYMQLSIPLDEITGIQVERVHAGKTTLAVIAGVIVIPPFLALGALEDSSWFW